MNHGLIAAQRTRPAAFTSGYDAALKALRRCSREYSLGKYIDAMAALQYIVDNDEIEAVANKADALSDYCKVASDNTLMRLAAKVDALHKAASSRTAA